MPWLPVVTSKTLLTIVWIYKPSPAALEPITIHGSFFKGIPIEPDR